ncbi:MAG: PilZ domain-containing protein [Tepidisphaeraceae bacterium]
MMTLVREPPIEVEEQESGVERRRGLRIAQNRPIKVFEPTSARYFAGQTHDISATGLRIELPVSTPLREGNTLSIHVGLNAQGQGLANRRQMIPARVVWVDRPGEGRTLSLGVEFQASISAHLDAA